MIENLENIWNKFYTNWSTARFAAWRFFLIMNMDLLKMVYFVSFHSIIKHGIIFLGDSTNISCIYN